MPAAAWPTARLIPALAGPQVGRDIAPSLAWFKLAGLKDVQRAGRREDAATEGAASRRGLRAGRGRGLLRVLHDICTPPVRCRMAVPASDSAPEGLVLFGIFLVPAHPVPVRPLDVHTAPCNAYPPL